MSNFQNKDNVLTDLIHRCYLSYNNVNQTVPVPNEEIRQTLETTLKCFQ